MRDLPTRTLSVRQPWAWAIIHAGKTIENRGKGFFHMRRHSEFLGRIAIHAAKGMTQDEYRAGMETINAILGDGTCPPPAELVRGAIVGSVTVTAVVSKSQSPWFFGAFGLVLADPEPCDPIPAAGRLGYFEWNPAEQGGICEPLRWMTRWGKPTPAKEQVGALGI